MRVRRFQNHVAASNYTLPVVTAVTTALWFGNGILSSASVLTWAMSLLIALLWWQTNHKNALIRIRSRLIPALCLAFFCCNGFAYHSPRILFPSLCSSISFYFLAASYQQREGSRHLFHAFLFLSAGSLILPKTLWFAPLYFWYCAFWLQSLTLKSFVGGLLGCILPFWLVFGYALATGDFSFFIDFYEKTVSFEWPSFAPMASLDAGVLAGLGWTACVTCLACIHCARNNFNEKIRTRMLLYIIITQLVATLFFLLLFPSDALSWTALLLTYGSVISGHYFSLTHQRYTNLLFIATLCILILTALRIIWIQ